MSTVFVLAHFVFLAKYLHFLEYNEYIKNCWLLPEILHQSSLL